MFCCTHVLSAMLGSFPKGRGSASRFANDSASEISASRIPDSNSFKASIFNSSIEFISGANDISVRNKCRASLAC